MFAFSWIYSLVSLFITACVYMYIENRDSNHNWGPAADARRYIRATRALYDLEKVQTSDAGHEHVKTFRPQYLVLTGDPREDMHLLAAVSKFHKGRGVVLAAVIRSAGQDEENAPEWLESAKLRREISAWLKAEPVRA